MGIAKVHERWLHFVTPLRRDDSALIRFILSAERGANCEDLRHDFLSSSPECGLVVEYR